MNKLFNQQLNNEKMLSNFAEVWVEYKFFDKMKLNKTIFVNFL